MAKLQKLRSSRSEEKLPSSHGSRGKGNRSMTDYEYNSFDEMDSKDDDNDVLFARKLFNDDRKIFGNIITTDHLVYSYFFVTHLSSSILEYNEHNYGPINRLGINVDIDGNPLDIPFSNGKMNGGHDSLANGDDIVLVRKRNQQQLFTRTYNEDDDLKNLRMGGSMMNRYGTIVIVLIVM